MKCELCGTVALYRVGEKGYCRFHRSSAVARQRVVGSPTNGSTFKRLDGGVDTRSSIKQYRDKARKGRLN